MENKGKQRKNTKPSSSCRSANILGNQKSAFPTQIKKALGPCSIGVCDGDKLIESPANENLYNLIRKLDKKDPITKKKALEELIKDIDDVDVEEVVKFLPLWPKTYQNLAFDPTHTVRELTQVVQKMLAAKCNRNIAPYLKKLVPVWLFSHFDNYAPVANTARTSFYDTFSIKSNRIQEVCLHCQLEILQYIHDNLAKSVNSKNAENSADNKIYQSIEVLSFFTEHTKTVNLLPQSLVILRSILDIKQFWSFGKQGVNNIRTAWFKVIYNLLQNEYIEGLLLEYKWKIIAISFNGIVEKNSLLSSTIWEVILYLQYRYEDWYSKMDYEYITEKLICLFQNNLFNNFDVICPKLLPFYSALMCAYSDKFDWRMLLENLLTQLKKIFCSMVNAKQDDYKFIFEAYFDCWNLILNKCYNDDYSEEITTYLSKLLHTTIIEPIGWLLSANKPVASKIYFCLTIKTIAEWQNKIGETGNKELLRVHLLKKFWQSILDLISDFPKNSEHFPEEIIDLIQYLEELNDESIKENTDSKQSDGNMTKANKERLEKVASELSLGCLDKIGGNEYQNCIRHIHSFINIFPEPDFCKTITNSSNLNDAIKHFLELTAQLDKEYYLDVAEIVFKLLNFLDNDAQFNFVKANLFSMRQEEMQVLILERLLDNSLRIQSQREVLLSGPDARTFIRNIIKSALVNKSLDINTLWEKLLFQDKNGAFIVGAHTIDALLDDICEHLQNKNNLHLSQLCGKLLSQVMPIIFNDGQILNETKTKMFTKLFQILMESTAKSFVSEETQIKLKSCWENVLLNEHIVTEEAVSFCINFVKHMLVVEKLEVSSVIKCANYIADFITSTTRSSTTGKVSSTALNELIARFLSLNDISALLEKLYQYCLSLEAINGIISTKELSNQFLEHFEFGDVLQRALLNLYIIERMNNLQKLDEIKNNLSLFELKLFNSNLCNELLNCIAILSAGENIIKIKHAKNVSVGALVQELQKQIISLIRTDCILIKMLEEQLLAKAAAPHISFCRSLHFLVYVERYEMFEENANIIFTEEILSYLLEQDAFTSAVYFLQYQLPTLNHKSITAHKIYLCAKSPSVWIKCASLRCLVLNSFKRNEMESSDRMIISQLLKSYREISEKMHTEKRLLHDDLNNCRFDKVFEHLEYIRFMTAILENIPWSLSSKEWDDITTGICFWTSTILQTIELFTDLRMALLIINVYQMFGDFIKFIKAEKISSSTALIRKTIDEWDSLSAKEVNQKIFQTLCKLLELQGKASIEYFSLIFNEVKNAVIHLDFHIVYSFCKSSTSITPERVFNLMVKNFSNPNVIVQRTCYSVLHELTHHYVVEDTNSLKMISSTLQPDDKAKHYLKLFEDFLTSIDPLIEEYNSQFSFKISEIDEFESVDNPKAFSYLLMWDCIIHACVKAPLFVRSIYTSWLYGERYFEKFLHFLLRVMPTEILKNHDTKFITCEIFNELSQNQINDDNLTLERYACHLYTKVLKKLPAVVRKWWNVLPSRQKVFVDKLTTNFVSSIISDEELKSLAANKERHDNMQVTVHLSTREVFAVYFIDEVRTELTLTLAPNHPLGVVKVECGKNIGGRLSSRNIGMQLALFLTHQNGTILDGLALWKSSLDKKFEGIEECYVCYTVIHHDTCQLPKLTCKTCKKKFHGSCLYKWFTTSSKSTCPICRNVF